MQRTVVIGLVILPLLLLAAGRSATQITPIEPPGRKTPTPARSLDGVITSEGLKPFYVPPTEIPAETGPSAGAAPPFPRGEAGGTAGQTGLSRLDTLELQMARLIQRVNDLDRRIAAAESTLYGGGAAVNPPLAPAVDRGGAMPANPSGERPMDRQRNRSEQSSRGDREGAIRGNNLYRAAPAGTETRSDASSDAKTEADQ